MENLIIKILPYFIIGIVCSIVFSIKNRPESLKRTWTYIAILIFMHTCTFVAATNVATTKTTVPTKQIYSGKEVLAALNVPIKNPVINEAFDNMQFQIKGDYVETSITLDGLTTKTTTNIKDLPKVTDSQLQTLFSDTDVQKAISTLGFYWAGLDGVLDFCSPYHPMTAYTQLFNKYFLTQRRYAEQIIKNKMGPDYLTSYYKTLPQRKKQYQPMIEKMYQDFVIEAKKLNFEPTFYTKTTFCDFLNSNEAMYNIYNELKNKEFSK